MAIFSKLWFWFLMLIFFLTLILYDKDLDKDLQSAYLKQKMHLTDVHFSEMDQSFEQARFYADVVEMDDGQNNMIATNVRGLFFDKLVATRSGELTSKSGSRNQHETMFWGDVKIHTTDRERMRTDELRFIPSRDELYTSFPVTIWKDDMVVTGKELRFNTKTREGGITSNVVIRIWNTGSGTTPVATSVGILDIFPVPAGMATGAVFEDILASTAPHGIMIREKSRPRTLFDEGIRPVLSAKRTRPKIASFGANP